MAGFAIRRLLLGLPALLLVAAAIWALVEFAPGEGLAAAPTPLPPAAQAEMRRALGLGEPAPTRFLLWLRQLAVVEPGVLIDRFRGTELSAGEARILSWRSGRPVTEEIAPRLRRTLAALGIAAAAAVLIAVPVGLGAALRPRGVLDGLASALALVGRSVPPFVVALGVLAAGWGWLAAAEDGGGSWGPALVGLSLAPLAAGALLRSLRGSVREALAQEHVLTARAKGMREATVIRRHVLRNALAPVAREGARGVPLLLGGALLAEAVLGVDGLGTLLARAAGGGDLALLQVLAFLLAVLVLLVLFLAGLVEAQFDPRRRDV